MGRPQTEINKDQFEKLCELHCTKEEIANIMDCDEKTLNAWCQRTYGVTFSLVYRQKASNGKMSIRRAQFSTATKGNVTMLIWLGKQWLGQKEKSDEKAEEPSFFTSEEEIKEYADFILWKKQQQKTPDN